MTDAAQARALLAGWRERPAPARCLAALDACAADDLPGALAAVELLLAEDDWLGPTIAALIAQAAANPLFAPPFEALSGSVQDGLLLVDHPLAVISVAVIPVDLLARRKVVAGGRGAIGFSGQVTRYRVIRAGGATLSWWHGPRIDARFDAADRPRCRRTGEHRLADGELFTVDGREAGFIVEGATADLVLLQATLVPGRAPLTIEYDAETLDYAAASATDPAASHRQMMATFLRHLDRRDAAPALAELARDPAFFVRWHAVRELAALDRAASLPVFAAMAAGDPRRDIAAAAAIALARLAPEPAVPCPA